LPWRWRLLAQQRGRKRRPPIHLRQRKRLNRRQVKLRRISLRQIKQRLVSLLQHKARLHRRPWRILQVLPHRKRRRLLLSRRRHRHPQRKLGQRQPEHCTATSSTQRAR